MTLRPCSDLWAADWITAARRPWQQLVGFGPPGFRAYGRLRFLPDPAHEGQSANDVVHSGDRPSETEQLRAALAILGRRTDTPDDCYFCLWDGWGQPTAGSPLRHQPRAVLPHRAYFLFHGAVSELDDWGAGDVWSFPPGLGAPAPAFVWPADHAWCVANDVDPHWAGIGADAPAIQALAADPRLDVVPADPVAGQPSYR